MTGRIKPPVRSAEKYSVERVNIRAAQRRTGSHARNHWPEVISDRHRECGRASETSGGRARRRKNQKRLASLHPVVRGFARDDDVVNVALAQARSGYAQKARLLAEFLERRGAAIPHPASQSADQLVR